MAPNDPRAVREPVGVGCIRRAQQQRRRVDRAAGDDDNVGSVALGFSVAPNGNTLRLTAGRAGLDALDIGIGQQCHVRMPQRGPDRDDMRVRLGLHEAGKAVAGAAANAVAVLHTLLVEHDADRQWKRVMSGALEIVRELLDARLVRDCRERVGLFAGRLGRVAPSLPVHMIKPLGFGVIGCEIYVRQRPGGRHSVSVPDHFKIPLAHTQQYSTVHLGVATDPVMNAGMERATVLVVPGLACLVALFAEDRFRIPILALARQVAAALDDHDALARGSQPVGERAAAGAAADDDDVVAIGAHGVISLAGMPANSQWKMQRWSVSWWSLAQGVRRPSLACSSAASSIPIGGAVR